MDVLDWGHQLGGETHTHRDEGGIAGWRDGGWSAERKKKKKAPHEIIKVHSRVAAREKVAGQEKEEIRPMIFSGARLLSAASTTSTTAFSVMLRQSGRVAARLPLSGIFQKHFCLGCLFNHRMCTKASKLAVVLEQRERCWWEVAWSLEAGTHRSMYKVNK